MSDSRAATDIALEVVRLAQEDDFAGILERFSPALQTLVDAGTLRAAWEIEIERQGAVVSLGDPVYEPAGPGVTLVRVPVSCAHGGMTVMASVNEPGVLIGLQLAPAEAARPPAPWEPPAYANASSFTERTVELGTGPLAVSGTLSVPTTPGPYPGVVMLAGSGPADRDGTIGPNKPLKDLAWGLSSRGIATLRFDKVTFAHPDEVRRLANFTLDDEYVPAALAAIGRLRQEPGIDARRIFLAGHSLGGTAAPRVARADGAIAGLVLLAAGAVPLHRALVRQVRYLASLDEAVARASAPMLARLERQADLVDGDALDSSLPASELPLGVPASYWRDFRRCDPVGTARELGCPILLVQGGRDYQATVEDDLALWRAGLSGTSRVAVQVYPAANHLLASGSGPSSPAEYERPGHVDVEIVEDVAAWLVGAGLGQAPTGER